MQTIHAVAFQAGDVWVVQGIEYDIVTHAASPSKILAAFAKAVNENIQITKYLGRQPLEGIGPGPEEYRKLFEEAVSEMRPVGGMANRLPVAEMAVRLSERA